MAITKTQIKKWNDYFKSLSKKKNKNYGIITTK